MQKKSVAFAAALFALPQVATARDDMKTVRAFHITWSQAEDSDQDVQMCDDNYYSHAEIWMATDDGVLEDKVRKTITDSCPDLTVDEVSYVSDGGRGYVRFLLSGTWGCSVTFEKRITKYSPKAARYTIDLSDAC